MMAEKVYMRTKQGEEPLKEIKRQTRL